MKLQSDFAILDVRHGRKQLDRLITKYGTNHNLPDEIPVVVHGFIIGRQGYDDGVSQEFTIRVTRVEVNE